MKWLINLPNIFDEEVTWLKLTSESLIYFEVRVIYIQKQPPRGVLKKRCSENMQKILALWHACSPVNLLHIFRTPFAKNTSERLLLKVALKTISFRSIYLHHIFRQAYQLAFFCTKNSCNPNILQIRMIYHSRIY